MHAKQIAVAELLIGAPFRSYAAIAASTRPENNVVGIGVGQKVKNGHKTDELAVRVYVERKLAPGLIMDEFKLPTSVEGVSVDVVETGRFRALSTVVPIGQRWRRPARPGCSIGFQFTGSMAGYVMAGTFGAMVQSNGERYILSNNHVLANENSLPVGSAIFQPGLLDHGNPNTDAIARLTKFVSLKKNAPNSLDCAIAEILDGKKTALPTFLPRVGSLASGQVADAAEEMPVHKVGRTTGYTK